MYKTILKLATAGVLITSLLAVVMITQGCDNKNDPTPQTTQTGQMTETTQMTQTTQPSQNIIIDETGIHIQIPTEETTAATQPTEPAPTEKPGLGEIIQDFFENLFGGGENQPTEQPDEPETTVPDGTVTYLEYMDMDDDQKEAFEDSFPTLKDFSAWFRKAQKEYNDNVVSVTIGPDGNINLEDFLKP